MTAVVQPGGMKQQARSGFWSEFGGLGFLEALETDASKLAAAGTLWAP